MLRVARVTTVLGAAFIAVAASCFTKPDEPHVNADARMDGMGTGIDAPGTGIDAPSGPPTCPSSTGVWDNFENPNGNACGTWGTGHGSATVPIVRTGGKLQVSTNAMGQVFCQTVAPIPITNGISIEIPQIAPNGGMYASTFFRVRPSVGAADAMEVHLNNMMGAPTPMVVLNCMGSTITTTSFQYSSTQHRWWKFELHPSFVGQVLHAYFASDGANWMDSNFLCTLNASASSVVVEMGVEGLPGGNNALFDNFNVKTCPP